MVSAGPLITSTAVPSGQCTSGRARRRHQPTCGPPSDAPMSICLAGRVQETTPSTTSNLSTIGTAVICRSVSTVTISATDASSGAVVSIRGHHVAYPPLRHAAPLLSPMILLATHLCTRSAVTIVGVTWMVSSVWWIDESAISVDPCACAGHRHDPGAVVAFDWNTTFARDRQGGRR